MAKATLAVALCLALATLASCTHVLEYFDVMGRAEAVRIALHAAGVEFTDKHYGWQEWQEFKAGTSDFVYKNGLPVLTVDGQKFSQSLAMMRYAGRKGNLYSDDLLIALRIDEILDIVQDMLAKAPSAEDEAEKLKLRAEYGAGKMKLYMSRLDQLLQQSSTPWIAGTPDISIADLAVWQLLLMIRKGDFDGIDKGYTDAFPAVAGLEGAVTGHRVVTAYYAARPAKQDL